MERRLAAVLVADIVGYSRLMNEDEEGTLRAVKDTFKSLIDPKVSQYHGRIIKLTGDGALMEFASAVDAVAFAVEVQCAMRDRNRDLPEERRIEYRIGINIGDIIIEPDDIYGDGVNIAARLEGLADPGAICVAGNVFDQVKGKLDLTFEPLGERKVKNIPEPISAYGLVLDNKADSLVTDILPVVPQRKPRSFAWAAGAALIIVAVFVGWWRPWAHQTKTVLIERPSDLPAIAVLPFDNMSGDPKQVYFSDGITDDLITDLSRVSGLLVIARNSVFTYKGRPVKVQRVGRELGVRYVVEGSVRKAGDRVRINAQLIDAQTGHHLWSERYDRKIIDMFSLQDEVVQKIVAALAIKLTKDEEARLSQATQANPDAYDLLLRGLERFRRFTRDDNAAARTYFERAVALDPRFTRALANLAWSHALDVGFGWTNNPDASIEMSLKIAQQALALDESNVHVHIALSSVYRRQRRFEDSVAAARRTIELDPNYADGYANLASVLNYYGQPKEALKAIGVATRLNPRNPFFFRQIAGHAMFLLGRYKEAAAAFETALKRNPHFIRTRLILAATYAHLGRTEDAKWEVQEILTLAPAMSLDQERARGAYKNSAHLERYIEGLRKAGMPK